MRVRKAKAGDVKAMHALINKFAKKDEMLPRSLTEIYENIRDFFVCAQGEKIKGTAALHILWEDLAEIRSIAVLEEYQRSGIGKKLIDQCIKEAGTLGIKRIFALTYYPEFFKKMGFEYKVNELCTILGEGYELVNDVPIKEIPDVKAIIDKNARIGKGVRIINKNKLLNYDGDNYFIRDKIVIIPKNSCIKDGALI